jgi:hypothetical protein
MSESDWLPTAIVTAVVIVLSAAWLVRGPSPRRAPTVTHAGELDGDAEAIGTLLRRHGPWQECHVPQSGGRPTVRVYVRTGEFHADMVTIWNLGCAGACRVAMLPGEDPRDATTCLWHWTGPAVEAVKAVCALTLPSSSPRPNRLPYSLPALCRPPTADCPHLLTVVDIESVSESGGNVLRCDACQQPVGESFSA